MQRQSGAYISHRWMSLLLEELVFRVLGRSPNYHQSQQVQFYANRQIVFMSQSEIGLRVSFDAGILPRQLHRDEVRCRARICFRHRMPLIIFVSFISAPDLALPSNGPPLTQSLNVFQSDKVG